MKISKKEFGVSLMAEKIQKKIGKTFKKKRIEKSASKLEEKEQKIKRILDTVGNTVEK